MSKIAIKHPRVFVSYAWEDENYKDRVRSFASDLMGDGIDVELDQWSLKEGYDMYAFMERSVTDPSVTNVLVLLSPQYALKADAREGGVGTETQIISPEVYGKAEQTKFLPVVFQRDENGNVCKPAYLGGTLYFDLSDPKTFGREYKRLVNRLYGIETHRKPELGRQPFWLDEENTPTMQSLAVLDSLRGNEPAQIKHRTYDRLLKDVLQDLLTWEAVDSSSNNSYIESYLSALPFRDAILEVVRYYPYVEDGCQMTADGFEAFRLNLRGLQGGDNAIDLKSTLLHELFIYLAGIAIEYADYEALGHVLGRDYLLDAYSGKKRGLGLFFNHDDKLEEAVKERDGQRWISAMAKFWLENLNVDACRRDAFILADELCYNAALLKVLPQTRGLWFPKTYIYDSDNLSIMRGFVEKFVDGGRLLEMARSFGFADVDGFVAKYRMMEDAMKSGAFDNHRYFESYFNAPLLCHFVAADQLSDEV